MYKNQRVCFAVQKDSPKMKFVLGIPVLEIDLSKDIMHIMTWNVGCLGRLLQLQAGVGVGGVGFEDLARNPRNFK